MIESHKGAEKLHLFFLKMTASRNKTSKPKNTKVRKPLICSIHEQRNLLVMHSVSSYEYFDEFYVMIHWICLCYLHGKLFLHITLVSSLPQHGFLLLGLQTRAHNRRWIWASRSSSLLHHFPELCQLGLNYMILRFRTVWITGLVMKEDLIVNQLWTS